MKKTVSTILVASMIGLSSSVAMAASSTSAPASSTPGQLLLQRAVDKAGAVLADAFKNTNQLVVTVPTTTVALAQLGVNLTAPIISIGSKTAPKIPTYASVFENLPVRSSATFSEKLSGFCPSSNTVTLTCTKSGQDSLSCHTSLPACMAYGQPSPALTPSLSGTGNGAELTFDTYKLTPKLAVHKEG